MIQADDKQNIPASLFLTIDDFDRVSDASVMETSDDNSRKYIAWQTDKIKNLDTIPDETVVEFRFPNRAAIPPFNPGLLNEYFSRDLYYALEGKNIPCRHTSLRVAAFLAGRGADVLQPEVVYRRIMQTPEYREFSYMNSRGLYNHPNRLDAEDRGKLASIRAEGGSALADILPARSKAVEPTVNAEKKSAYKIGNTRVRRNVSPVTAKRFSMPKRTKGRSL